VLAGLADGSVYVSDDAGATWTSAGTPEASAILKVVINRYSPNLSQWFALTAANYWVTVDGGDNWTALLTAGAGESFADAGHSFDRGFMVVGDAGAGTPLARDSGGVDQDFSGIVGLADLVAVAPKIEGGYVAYDSAGKTVECASGSTTWAACGANLPTGSGLVVQARGSGGMGRSRTCSTSRAGARLLEVGGWLRLGGWLLPDPQSRRGHQPGRGGLHAGGRGRSVGDGGRVTTTTVVSNTSTKVKNLWKWRVERRSPVRVAGSELRTTRVGARPCGGLRVLPDHMDYFRLNDHLDEQSATDARGPRPVTMHVFTVPGRGGS